MSSLAHVREIATEAEYREKSTVKHVWSPKWQHYLERMLQFCNDANTPLMMLTGPLGAGKSVLLDQLNAHIPQRPVHLIKGSIQLNVIKFAGELAKGYALKIPLSQSGDVDTFKDISQQLVTGETDRVLLIDDAHTLPKATLDALVELTQQDQTRLHLVLSGEPSFLTNFEKILTAKEIEIPLATLAITPLNLSETQHYLQERHAQLNPDEPFVFTENDIVHIHKLSGGVPGRINRVSQQALVNHDQTDEGVVTMRAERDERIASMPAKTRVGFVWRRHRVKMMSLLGLAALVWLGVNQMQNSTMSNLHPPASQRQMPKIALPLHASPLGELDLAAKTQPAKTPAPKTSVKAVQTAPTQTAAPVAATQGIPAWMQGEGYTLQLMGSHDAAQIQQMAAQLGEQVHMVTLQLHGQPWHVLVAGHFSTMDEAHAAVQKLPAEFQARHPWPRSLKNIRSSVAQ